MNINHFSTFITIISLKSLLILFDIDLHMLWIILILQDLMLKKYIQSLNKNEMKKLSKDMYMIRYLIKDFILSTILITTNQIL